MARPLQETRIDPPGTGRHDPSPESGLNEKRILARGVDHMRRPVVGIIGNSHRIENRFPVQAVGERNLRAVAEVSGAIPVMFASIPEIPAVAALLEVVDG